MKQPVITVGDPANPLQNIYALFDEVPFAMTLLKGPDLVIEYINSFALSVWKTSRQEVLNKPLFEAMPGLRAEAEPIHQQVYQSAKRFKENEVPVVIGDANARYFNVIIDPLTDESGQIIGQLVTSIEVTEQVQARKKVQQSEQQLRLITDALPALISYVDKEYRYQFHNKAYEDWFGHEAAEVRNKTMTEVLGKEAFDKVAPNMRKALSGERLSFESLLPYKDGGSRYVHVDYIPHKEAAGNVQGCYVMVSDLSDRREAEKELLYRKALLEAQNEAIPDAVLVVDTKGKILSFNKHFAELWHIPDSIIDAHDDTAALRFAMTLVTDPQGFIERVAYCYNHPEEAAHEEVLLKDGRIIERYGNAVIGEDGTSFGWIWYFRDVTERKQKEQALKASEDRYQNFIRQSSEGIWRFEVEQPIATSLSVNEQIELFFRHAYLAECNDAMARMYGYQTAGELIGAKLEHFFPRSQDTEDYLTYFISSGYNVEETESKELDRNGHQKYFLNNLLGIVEDGYLVRAWGTQRDITAQKDAEEKLKESEQRFRSLANDTRAFMFTADAETNINFVNRQWLQFVGLSSEDGLGKAWAEVTHPDDVAPMMEVYTQAVIKQEPYHFEIRQKNADGEYRWVLWNGIPRIAADGSFAGMSGIGIDITEQKQVQEIIRESEERFRQLADLVPQIIWTSNADGFINYYNKRWYEFTGLKEGFGDGSWQPFVHPHDVDAVTEAWYRSVRTGWPLHIEYRLREANTGEYRWVLCKAIPVKNEAGAITKWFGANTDVHDQKTLTEKLEKMIAERTSELQRSNEDLQQFAHVASHDLKEPVRKVKTFSNRLNYEFGTVLPDKAKSYLRKMEAAADRMYAMIDGILVFSSLDAVDQATQPVDLTEIIKNIEEDLEILIEEKGGQLSYTTLPVVKGSPVLLHQLFYNLINNSLKFSKPGVSPLIQINSESLKAGELTNASLANHGYVNIRIKDNGIGFDQEQAQKIFKTFYRLNAKDKYEGTGLGLALCKKIVERHGGSIKAEGKEGEGAVFTIALPVEQ